MAPIDEGRRGPDSSHGGAPVRKSRAGFQGSQHILPNEWESQLLSHRIGRLRAHRALGLAGLEAAAGRVIDAHPTCSARASRLVDRLVVAMDLARLEGRP